MCAEGFCRLGGFRGETGLGLPYPVRSLKYDVKREVNVDMVDNKMARGG